MAVLCALPPWSEAKLVQQSGYIAQSSGWAWPYQSLFNPPVPQARLNECHPLDKYVSPIRLKFPPHLCPSQSLVCVCLPAAIFFTVLSTLLLPASVPFNFRSFLSFTYTSLWYFIIYKITRCFARMWAKQTLILQGLEYVHATSSSH